MRDWQNAVNSSYNALQASLKRQMAHGLLFNVSYTYSHSIAMALLGTVAEQPPPARPAAMATPPIFSTPVWIEATRCSIPGNACP